jgi:hypothetical protein
MRRTRRPSQPRRGFRIVDGLVAIGVTAVGLVWARTYWGRTIGSIPSWSWTYKPVPGWLGGDPLYESTRELILTCFHVGATLAATWGVALVILRRVRRPGSPFWRARRPGALACLASTVVLALILAIQSVRPSSNDLFEPLVGLRGEVRAVTTFHHHDASSDWSDPLDPFLNTALQMPRATGFVVAGAWIALALAGRWRPERSWIDRLGRAIGVFWIAAAIHFLIFPL